MRLVFAAAALLAVNTASAGPLSFGPAPGFEVYTQDAAGGGWVINRMPGRGDTLWGCGDVKSVETCTQVYFNDWRSGTKLNFLHVSKDSMKAWLVLTAPGFGDVLLACSEPEGTPMCSVVELDIRPKLASYSRVWPDQACVSACGGDACCGDTLPETDPRALVEDKAMADMWLQVGTKLPGPSNMYACTGLAAEPVCQLAVPNWLALDRENLGFKKLEDIENEGADGEVVYGPGVLVSKLDEESVAYEAGFREGDIILKVGEYETNQASHARNLMLQYPALAPMPVTKGDGTVVELVARRKPKKK